MHCGRAAASGQLFSAPGACLGAMADADKGDRLPAAERKRLKKETRCSL